MALCRFWFARWCDVFFFTSYALAEDRTWCVLGLVNAGFGGVDGSDLLEGSRLGGVDVLYIYT